MKGAPLSRHRDDDRKVVPLDTSDAAIVSGLQSGEPWAANALYDRYSAPIERMLRRTLGYERHADFEDLLHEVFVQALSSAPQLKDAVALLAWLRTITTRVAIRTIRRRKARNWLRFLAPEEVPEIEVSDPSQEVRQACGSFYCLVRKLPAKEQVVFTLRHVDGLELGQLAEACEMSLSTAKRRLLKAETRFFTLAADDPVLSSWMTEDKKWST
jgi:RNA polymerase sigma-70 factor (ECF subfamily)